SSKLSSAPLPNDPYVAVRQAQLVDTDTESDPEEAPLEVEDSQPLGSRVPFMGKEFEAFDPSSTWIVSSHLSVSTDSTAPLSLDHLLTQVSPTLTPTRALFYRRTAHMTMRAQPVMSPGHSSRVAEAMALSDTAFRKSEGDELGDEDTGEGGEDESSDADDERDGLNDKGHGLVDEDHGLENEGLGLEEEVIPEVSSMQFRLWIRPRTGHTITWVDPKYGSIYTGVLIYPPVAPVQTSSSPEWSFDSLPISPSSLVVPSSLASPVATLIANISVDEDHFPEVGVQVELHRSLLYDHTQHLDALPPTLFVDIDRDVRELYTRLREIRDEIFSQRFRFRSLEHEHERATVTFRVLWRPVLAVKAWGGHVDTRMTYML
nr:hypothetical protein [Tanacetum cinerariifolium]